MTEMLYGCEVVDGWTINRKTYRNDWIDDKSTFVTFIRRQTNNLGRVMQVVNSHSWKHIRLLRLSVVGDWDSKIIAHNSYELSPKEEMIGLIVDVSLKREELVLSVGNLLCVIEDTHDLETLDFRVF